MNYRFFGHPAAGFPRSTLMQLMAAPARSPAVVNGAKWVSDR